MCLGQWRRRVSESGGGIIGKALNGRSRRPEGPTRGGVLAEGAASPSPPATGSGGAL